MKIVTVNVPEWYINAIAKLVGEKGLYPSRSEVIRVATREFLLRELKKAKFNDELETYDKEKEVKVANDGVDKMNGFSTYKILRRLE